MGSIIIFQTIYSGKFPNVCLGTFLQRKMLTNKQHNNFPKQSTAEKFHFEVILVGKVPKSSVFNQECLETSDP